MNITILVGHLGGDPELTTTKSGTPMCKMRLATQKRWTDDSGVQQSRTDWHNLRAFGSKAERYHDSLSQGDKITVRGEIRVSEWHDKHQQFQRRVSIFVDQIEFPVSSEDDGLEDEFFGDGFLP